VTIPGKFEYSLHCAELELEQLKDNVLTLRSFKSKFKNTTKKRYKCRSESDCISIILFYRNFQNLVFNQDSVQKIKSVSPIGIDTSDPHLNELLHKQCDTLSTNINFLMNNQLVKIVSSGEQIPLVLNVLLEVESKFSKDLIKIKSHKH